MFIRKFASLAAVAGVALLATAASASAAHTAIRTDPGNSLLTSPTTIRNTTSDSSTLTLSGLGTIHCSQTFFEATLHANTGPSITGTLNSLTFTTCTDTIPVVNISDCTLDPASPLPTVHVTATNSNGGTIQITDPRVRCALAGSASACYYTGTSDSAIGAASNSLSQIVYSSVIAHHVTGSNDLGVTCGSSFGTFNATLTHIVQVGTNRTITVTTS